LAHRYRAVEADEASTSSSWNTTCLCCRSMANLVTGARDVAWFVTSVGSKSESSQGKLELEPRVCILSRQIYRNRCHSSNLICLRHVHSGVLGAIQADNLVNGPRSGKVPLTRLPDPPSYAVVPLTLAGKSSPSLIVSNLTDCILNSTVM
jgi:hypothetical protein